MWKLDDPGSVVRKILQADADLGGISRITFQMSSAFEDHEAMKRSIELLGTRVAPIVRNRTESAEIRHRNGASIDG